MSHPPDLITLRDLEVHFRVGVPETERAQPQRLLLTVVMETDVTAAAAGDDIGQTIHYEKVTRRILDLGRDRAWKLIETLALDVAAVILAEFGAAAVTVEVKKFILPATREVSVTVTRRRE